MPDQQAQLLEYLSGFCKLNQFDMELLQRHWIAERAVRRNEYLIKPGQFETQLYFVLEGTFRIYYPHDDQEICVGFAYPNTLLCAYPSLIKKQASLYCIQCLSKAKLLSVSWTDFQAMLRNSRTFSDLWLMMTQEALLGKIERESEMLTFSPKQRLQRLLERSPHLFQWIPRKYIASYLRMSPETLSRIRLDS